MCFVCKTEYSTEHVLITKQEREKLKYCSCKLLRSIDRSDDVNGKCMMFGCRSFGVKDDIFCLFEGMLDNLGSLRQEYGLAKSADEVVLVIEAYKAMRDRAPYPPSRVVGHLAGKFAFVVFDKSTSTLFVATVSYFGI